MASGKISELAEKTTFTGGDYIPIVTGGVTKKISATNLLQTKADANDTPKRTTAIVNPATTPANVSDTFVNTDLGLVYASKGTTDVNDWVLLNRYRLFGFTVNQTGTDAPEYIFLTDESIGVLSFARTGTGVYTITSNYSSEFPEATTVGMGIFPYYNTAGVLQYVIEIIRTSALVITIKTYDNANTLTDDLLTGQYLEFKVFNPLS